MMRAIQLAVACVAGLVATAGQVQAGLISINFGDYPSLTPLSDVDGITFSLIGAPDSSGSPLTNYGGLTNSSNAYYPTAEILDFTFDNPVSNVSFNFSNQGLGILGGRGDSYFEAFDSMGTLLETGSLNGASNLDFTLASSGIKTLQFNNRTGGTDSWIFNVHSIEATSSVSAVPEPSSLALFGIGACVAGLGAARRRVTSQ